MKNMDCNVCYPEQHQLCRAKPYNGAAPFGRGYGRGHHRCAEHRYGCEEVGSPHDHDASGCIECSCLWSPVAQNAGPRCTCPPGSRLHKEG